MRIAASIVALVVAPWLGAGGAVAQSPLPLDKIRLPEGFSIELVARVPNARAMTWGAEGTLFVGSNNGFMHAVSFPRGAPPKPLPRSAEKR